MLRANGADAIYFRQHSLVKRRRDTHPNLHEPSGWHWFLLLLRCAHNLFQGALYTLSKHSATIISKKLKIVLARGLPWWYSPPMKNVKPSQAPQAYPAPAYTLSPYGPDQLIAKVPVLTGCTLWDMYAAHALCGLLAYPNGDKSTYAVAVFAAEHADALLAERERREKEAE